MWDYSGRIIQRYRNYKDYKVTFILIMTISVILNSNHDLHCPFWEWFCFEGQLIAMFLGFLHSKYFIWFTKFLSSCQSHPSLKSSFFQYLESFLLICLFWIHQMFYFFHFNYLVKCWARKAMSSLPRLEFLSLAITFLTIILLLLPLMDLRKLLFPLSIASWHFLGRKWFIL